MLDKLHNVKKNCTWKVLEQVNVLKQSTQTFFYFILQLQNAQNAETPWNKAPKCPAPTHIHLFLYLNDV